MPPDTSFTVPFLVNGETTAGAAGGATFPVICPATGETVWNAASATLADVNAAVAAASAALPAWRTTKLSRRRDLILRAAELLEESAAELAEAMRLETAADAGWCEFNVANASGVLRGVASRVGSIEGRVPESESDATVLVLKEPYGVVLSIAPWNAPVILAVRAIVYPLAAGNTVVFKSSELSPRTHFLVAEVFREAGFPAGTVNLLGHSREDAPRITEALIRAPAVRKVNFTGSTATGRRIAALAGEHLKPVTLELGGKAPMIVFDDADVAQAAAAGAFGAFHYAGQICMSCEKILVHRSIAAAFTTALNAAVAKAYGASQVLVQSAGPQRVSGLLLDAAQRGATLHPTPAATPSANACSNVVVTDVTPAMALWHTESFAPVVVVAEFDDEAEAVRMANDTEYGLSAAVWTRDVARGIRIARLIESGAVHINGPTVHDEAALPHGGVKNSGYGRFGSTNGLDEFLTTKTITLRG